jgi:hypothetical protein
MRQFRMLGVMLLVSVPLYAQDEMARKQAVEVAARVPFEKATKGAPYSAETLVESSQTLADGNRINTKTTGRVYRDSEGRTRRETDRPNGADVISIVDPVAGVSYSLDPVNKIAWKTVMNTSGSVMFKIDQLKLEMQKAEEERKVEERRKIEAEGPAGGGAPAGAGGRGRGSAVAPARVEPGGAVIMRNTGEAFKMTEGPLEHKTIEGLAVEGHRSATVIPAGQIGNEQPIKITSEEWISTDLKVLVLTHHSDPRMGDSSYRLINVIRAEPDRSLFIVPADYTVQDSGIRRMEDSRR